MLKIKAIRPVRIDGCEHSNFLGKGQTATIIKCLQGHLSAELDPSKQYQIVRDSDRTVLAFGYEFIKNVVVMEA